MLSGNAHLVKEGRLSKLTKCPQINSDVTVQMNCMFAICTETCEKPFISDGLDHMRSHKYDLQTDSFIEQSNS